MDDTSQGAPHNRPVNGGYKTSGDITVDFKVDEIYDSVSAVNDLIDKIDDFRGNSFVHVNIDRCKVFCKL